MNTQTLGRSVVTDVDIATEAFDSGDVETAKWALSRAREAASRLVDRPAKRQPRQRRAPSSSARKSAASRNGRGGRVPVSKRRAQMLELLHRADGPLTKAEVAEKLGTTTAVVERTVKSIDADLLEVAHGKGREQTRYALADQRSRAGV